MSSPTSEGHFKALDFDLFYRAFGKPANGTILVLHGGPGLDHQYMLPLADLAEYGFRVVFYDQLACGASARTRDIGLFTVERAVREVEAVRDRLRLEKVHLIGAGYGGLLALEYAIQYQGNLKTLTTIGGISSMPLVTAEMQRLKSQLPPETLEILESHEARGEYADPEYQRALLTFYRRHFCRLERWPKELNSSLSNANPLIISTMSGPTEFTVVGGLRYWDNRSRLHEISVPSLILSGIHDEVSPKEARAITRRIKGSRRVVFPKSSHLAMWEQRGACISEIRNFLGSNLAG